MMTPATIERWYPFVISALAIGVAAGVSCLFQPDPFPKALLAGTMTLGIVVSGLVAIQRNMLLTMSGARVMRFAVRTGYYKDVIAYLRDCIWSGLLVTGISLVGLFADLLYGFWIAWFSVLAGAIVLVICLLMRNEKLMNLIVTRYIEERTTPGNGG